MSPGEQGAAYAFAALTQLIRHENGIWTIRGADVLDWPGFEMRMDRPHRSADATPRGSGRRTLSS